MSSIALKFGSLVIRTVSKPIANYIKRQAREHPGFRKTCIAFAQSLHRIDMRWRIGLLQDAAALEKQAQRDAAKEAAKKKKSTTPTVKTEAQTKADAKAEEQAAKAEEEATEADKNRPAPKIRPLTEAKAIETGANFISETFLFGVAASLILFETWRSRRKDQNRRDVVKDRLDDLEELDRAKTKALLALEDELLELRARHPEIEEPPHKRILPKELYEQTIDDNEEKPDERYASWYSRIAAYIGSKEDAPRMEDTSKNVQGAAAKILAESDRVMTERHKRQAEEDAAAETGTSPKKSS